MQRSVEGDAEAELIGGGRGGAAAELLGRDEAEGAQHIAAGGQDCERVDHEVG